jgi:hypothetical protein
MWKVRIEIYWCLYKEIQEDRSIFWEVILSAIVKKKLYERMSNCEW